MQDEYYGELHSLYSQLITACQLKGILQIN